MPNPHRHMNFTDRRTTFQMIHETRTIDEFAGTIGCHRSTACREIGRNKVTPERENRPYRSFEHHRTEGYLPVSIDNLARRRRQQQCKLLTKLKLHRHLLDRRQGACPSQQIAGRPALQNCDLGRVCHETIDRYAGIERRANLADRQG